MGSPDYPIIIAGLLLAALAGIGAYAWRRDLPAFLRGAREATFIAMQDGAIVIDRRSRVVDLNPAARRLMNVPSLRRGEPAYMALPALRNLIVKDVEGDQVLQEDLRLSEHPALYVEARMSALRDRRGNPIGRLIVLRDVTVKRQVEEQLRLQSVALRAAANGIVITRRDGTILWVNPAMQRMTGYALEEMIGQHTRLLRSGVHDDAFYKTLWDTVLSGNVWRGEITNRRKDGSLYVEEQMIAPVADEPGEIRYFIAVKQDITERKDVEKLREDLTHTMVHDLRNPLASVISALQLLELDGAFGAEQRASILHIARQGAAVMLALVNSILDVSRLESGQMPVERRPVSPREMLDATLKIEEPLARQKNIQIDTHVPDDLPDVDADSALITRVLQNLIGNAIKFSPAGSSICVSARADGDHRQVVFYVGDSGSGIPAELMPRLFQKFVSGRNVGRGSGLGLAFCRLAVEAHGGRIQAESPPGEGATFSFTLPLAADP